MFSQGLLLRNKLFRAGRCAPVRVHRQQVPKASSLAAEHRRPHCKQAECTSSSWCAVQSTRYSPSGDPLHLRRQANNAGLCTSCVFFKQEAWPCHFIQDRRKWTLVDQSPATSETEWLCMDFDGNGIVSVYKSPPMRLQVPNLPGLPYPVLYAGDFNCSHVN